MEFFQQIADLIWPIFKNIYVQMGLLVVFATAHGYAGAWIAVRMLFRPRSPVKLFGLTVFPQGMIPRHRSKLAMAIGKAVGEELVSQETILHELTGNDFLRRKVQKVIDAYTDEILALEHPSLIESLPKNVREPVLDAISALQRRIAEHIRNILKSDESLDAIRSFVTRRVDEVLGQRVSSVVDDKTFEDIINFLEGRIRSAIDAKSFEAAIRDFSARGTGGISCAGVVMASKDGEAR